MQADMKVPFLPTAFFSIVSSTQSAHILYIREFLTKEVEDFKIVCLVTTSNQIKQNPSEAKLKELVSQFPSEDDCYTWVLDRLRDQRPDLLWNYFAQLKGAFLNEPNVSKFEFEKIPVKEKKIFIQSLLVLLN
jgi:hypothetical protein